MFRYTLQLRSNTRHKEEVSGGFFQPTLTYLFYHSQRTYKETKSRRNLNIVVPSTKQKKTLVVPLSSVPAMGSCKINSGDKSTKIGLATIVPENIVTTDPVTPFMGSPKAINAPNRKTSRRASGFTQEYPRDKFHFNSKPRISSHPLYQRCTLALTRKSAANWSAPRCCVNSSWTRGSMIFTSSACACRSSLYAGERGARA